MGFGGVELRLKSVGPTVFKKKSIGESRWLLIFCFFFFFFQEAMMWAWLARDYSSSSSAGGGGLFFFPIVGCVLCARLR